jgi:hypothetical protein
MKRICLGIIFLCAFASLTGAAHAQCQTGCLTSFTISPGSVLGDGSDFAAAEVGVYYAGSTPTYLGFELQQSGGPANYNCEAGQQLAFGEGCLFPVSPGNNTLQFLLYGYNYGTNPENVTITVSYDVYLNAPLSDLPPISAHGIIRLFGIAWFLKYS